MQHEKNMLLINNVYLDYDYMIKTKTNLCFVKTNLCGSSPATKGKLGMELHILSILDSSKVSINDIYSCIDKYNKYFYYKTIDYTYKSCPIKVIYVMRNIFDYNIKENKFSDLD